MHRGAAQAAQCFGAGSRRFMGGPGRYHRSRHRRNGSHHQQPQRPANDSEVVGGDGTVLVRHDPHNPATSLFGDLRERRTSPQSTRQTSRWVPRADAAPAEVVTRNPRQPAAAGGRKTVSQLLLEEFDRDERGGRTHGGSPGGRLSAGPTVAELRRRAELDEFERSQQVEEEASPLPSKSVVPRGDESASGDVAADGVLNHRHIGTKDIPKTKRGAVADPATRAASDRTIEICRAAAIIFQAMYCCLEACLDGDNRVVADADSFVVEVSPSGVRRMSMSVPFLVEALLQEDGFGVGAERLVTELLSTKYLSIPIGTAWLSPEQLTQLPAKGRPSSSPSVAWVNVSPSIANLLLDAIKESGGQRREIPPCLKGILFDGCCAVRGFAELSEWYLQHVLHTSESTAGSELWIREVYGAYCLLARMQAHLELVEAHQLGDAPTIRHDSTAPSVPASSQQSSTFERQDAIVLSQLEDVLASDKSISVDGADDGKKVVDVAPPDALWATLARHFQIDDANRNALLEEVFGADAPPPPLELRGHMVHAYRTAHGILHRLVGGCDITSASTAVAILNLADALGEELEGRVVPLLHALSAAHSGLSEDQDGLIACGVEQYLAHHLFPVRAAFLNIWINRLALMSGGTDVKAAIEQFSRSPTGQGAAALVHHLRIHQVLIRAAGELATRNAMRTAMLKGRYWAVSAAHQGQSHLVGRHAKAMKGGALTFGKGDSRGLGRSASFTVERDSVVDARLRSGSSNEGSQQDDVMQAPSDLSHPPVASNNASWSDRTRLVGTKGFVIPNHVLTTLMPFGTPCIGSRALGEVLEAYAAAWPSVTNPTSTPDDANRGANHSALLAARTLGTRLARTVLSQGKLVAMVYPLPPVRLQQRSKKVYFSMYNMKIDRDEAQRRWSTVVYTRRISQSLLDLAARLPTLQARLERARVQAERRFKRRQDALVNERAIGKQYEERRLKAERGEFTGDEDGSGVAWGVMQVQEVLNNALTAGGDSEGVSARTDASQGMGKMAVRVYFQPSAEVLRLVGGILSRSRAHWADPNSSGPASVSDDRLEELIQGGSLRGLPFGSIRILPTPTSAPTAGRARTSHISNSSKSAPAVTPEGRDATACVDYLLALSSAAERELRLAVGSDATSPVLGTFFRPPLDPGLVFEVDNLYLRKLHDDEMFQEAMRAGKPSSQDAQVAAAVKQSYLDARGTSDAHRDSIESGVHREAFVAKMRSLLHRP